MRRARTRPRVVAIDDTIYSGTFGMSALNGAVIATAGDNVLYGHTSGDVYGNVVGISLH